MTEYIFTTSNVNIDVGNGTVTRNGRYIYLSMLEYRLLLLLVKNAGKIVGRNELMEIISYGNCRYVNDNSLTVYMRRIREKLGDNINNPKIIKTVRGAGYYIVE